MPAPYSDNLYSADTDDEPDALSPTDGYFHASSASSSSRSPHVPNVLVEDPTQPSRDTKIQEAERERRLLNTGGSAGDELGNAASSQGGSEEAGGSENPIALTPHSQRASPVFAHPVDAPPAYSPSPTSPTTANNYQTFTSTATMGRPEDNQPLIIQAPQSMSNPSNPSQPPSRWQRVKDSVANINIRRKVKTVLAALVIFSVVFMIFSSFTLRSNHGSHSDPINDPDQVAPPSKDHDDFAWKPSRSCLNKPHRFARVIREVDIRPGRNLSIVQTVKNTHGDKGWTTHISGEIILRPAEDSSPANIELEVISNHDSLGIDLEFGKESQLLELIVPRKIGWGSSDKAPCVQVRATIWAPREAILNALSIDTLQLDVKIEEGFVLTALEGVNIRSASGDITAPGINGNNQEKDVVPYTLASREIRIRTASGDVRGWYPLYDLLDIETVSGDVSTNVGPKPVNPQDVRSATFRVRSASGEIKVDEPLDKAQNAPRPDREFPPRDYTVDILTASGDITADVAVSSYASFGSQSGDLKVRVWPVLDSNLLTSVNKAKPSLETDTKSGHTQVTILEPLWTSLATIGVTIPPVRPYDPEDDHEPYIILPKDSDDAEISLSKPALSVLSSKHKSISGGVKLFYPGSWEGLLFAQSVSGSQDYQGKGLQITHEGGSFAKIIRGQKGKGYSSLEVSTVSGDQFALIGEKDH
ncbi:hypothetical protein FSARC_11413 [Fusarium sarcochroum]|uniref:DUF4097 domain-containing protein n=1 Tax=Fusarium sarcochroum TaxID=1208366 RepID=A0A8H4TFQ3_9HYPO|nr:hypothetical protein FSARC_11413 [Fusarium sarcochroum]